MKNKQQKSRRRRIDVNVEELDQIVDRARQAPLSDTDYDKLKTALHALIERLLGPAKTESPHSSQCLSPAPLNKCDAGPLGLYQRKDLHRGPPQWAHFHRCLGRWRRRFLVIRYLRSPATAEQSIKPGRRVRPSSIDPRSRASPHRSTLRGLLY
jgi:hypothetical protein